MFSLRVTAVALLTAAALSPCGAAAQGQPEQAAQQGPPAVFMTSWRCDRAALDDLVAEDRERALPILQELVDEGRIWSASVMVHDWGDEWNYVTVMLADDVAAGAAAEDEYIRRYGERHGEGASDAFLERCPTHRDNIYVGAFTTGDGGADPEPPYTVAMSSFACPFNRMSEIVAAGRERFLPAATASIGAGMGYWAGGAQHAWGDEWNYVVFRSARDVAGLVAFADDTDERMERAAPDAPAATAPCWSHKDNLYRVELETAPREE